MLMSRALAMIIHFLILLLPLSGWYTDLFMV